MSMLYSGMRCICFQSCLFIGHYVWALDIRYCLWYILFHKLAIYLSPGLGLDIFYFPSCLFIYYQVWAFIFHDVYLFVTGFGIIMCA